MQFSDHKASIDFKCECTANLDQLISHQLPRQLGKYKPYHSNYASGSSSIITKPISLSD